MAGVVARPHTSSGRDRDLMDRLGAATRSRDAAEGSEHPPIPVYGGNSPYRRYMPAYTRPASKNNNGVSIQEP
jgi:hypothetical protein